MLVIACVACFNSCKKDPSLPADISMTAMPTEEIVHYTDAIISGAISFSGNTEKYVSSLKESLSVIVELEKKNTGERKTYPASLDGVTKEGFKVIIPFVVNPIDLEDGATYYYRVYYQFGKDEANVTNPVKFFTLPQGPVDLDLPSGLLWASHNLGADYPEDSGNYYSWGETEPKKKNGVYFWSEYKWCNWYIGDIGYNYNFTKYCSESLYGNNGFVDNKRELEPEDDAVVKAMGEHWRTPHPKEFTELLDECQHIKTSVNGISGVLYRSKKNPDDDRKVIFIPSSGYIDDVKLRFSNTVVCMTSLIASDLFCFNAVFWGGDGFGEDPRCYGYPIRPVCIK